MSEFGRDQAKVVMKKFELDPDAMLGVVELDDTHCVRLPNPPVPTDFIGNNWRRDLRLTVTEFVELQDCTLSGEEGINRSRKRHGL